MKMRPEHFRALQTAIYALEECHFLDGIRVRYQALGRSPQRFRWDALGAIPGRVREPLMKELYAYLNDSHIDTALKEILDNFDSAACHKRDADLGIASDPYERALERIDAIIERGQDPEYGTMRRLAATDDPGKVAGIYLAARDHRWPRIMREAARKYKETTGRNIKSDV